MVAVDENGYERGEYKPTDLIHRQVAYKEIYLKNRSKYPLPFSKYVVHHKDRDIKNNVASNLQILTPEEHKKVHGITKEDAEEWQSPTYEIPDEHSSFFHHETKANPQKPKHKKIDDEFLEKVFDVVIRWAIPFLIVFFVAALIILFLIAAYTNS